MSETALHQQKPHANHHVRKRRKGSTPSLRFQEMSANAVPTYPYFYIIATFHTPNHLSTRLKEYALRCCNWNNPV